MKYQMQMLQVIKNATASAHLSWFNRKHWKIYYFGLVKEFQSIVIQGFNVWKKCANII